MTESLHGDQLPWKVSQTHSGYFVTKNKLLLGYTTENFGLFCYGITQFILTSISSSWPVLYGKHTA